MSKYSLRIEPICEVLRVRGRSLKLVVLTNTPTPYRISFFNALLLALRARGAALHVLYCAIREPHRRWELKLDEQAYPWNVLPGWHPSVYGWYPHCNPSVLSHLRGIQPTWILSAGAWNIPTVLLAAQRILAGDSYRVFWSESHARAVLHPRGLIALARHRALRAYDAFAVPNEASARFVRTEAGDDATVLFLPNTVDDEFFTQPTLGDRRTARRRLGISETTKVIVSVAQLEPRKGVLELVWGYEALANEVRANSMLALVGEGSLRCILDARAKSLSHGEIRVVGHADSLGVRNWLWAADAFALATKRDPNPLSVIEAAFSGLPLIMSRQAGNTDELVHPGVNGMVLEQNDSNTIASVLGQVISQPSETLRVMGVRSHEIAIHGFGQSRVARQFVDDLFLASRITCL